MKTEEDIFYYSQPSKGVRSPPATATEAGVGGDIKQTRALVTADDNVGVEVFPGVRAEGSFTLEARAGMRKGRPATQVKALIQSERKAEAFYERGGGGERLAVILCFGR